jgi:hypothetical protein
MLYDARLEAEVKSLKKAIEVRPRERYRRARSFKWKAQLALDQIESKRESKARSSLPESHAPVEHEIGGIRLLAVTKHASKSRPFQ